MAVDTNHFCPPGYKFLLGFKLSDKQIVGKNYLMNVLKDLNETYHRQKQNRCLYFEVFRVMLNTVSLFMRTF